MASENILVTVTSQAMPNNMDTEASFPPNLEPVASAIALIAVQINACIGYAHALHRSVVKLLMSLIVSIFSNFNYR